jgi:toxin-antitoxin system PIN domain toxin
VALRSLLDVNVLIALHDQDHVHHALVADWFEREVAPDSAGWASCPLTQNGCLRIMCQPAYPNAVPYAQLLALLHGSWASPLHAFWADDVSLADEARFDAQRIHGHRQLTDVYLLGLAVKHKGRFVTLDAAVALAAVRGAQPRHLLRLLAV